MKRLVNAFSFNEPQVTAVFFLTLGNIIACANGASWWIWVIALTVYPAIAYTTNLILGPPPKD